jgi:predicted lipoprotein with Yx(FWY)xxD motif
MFTAATATTARRCLAVVLTVPALVVVSGAGASGYSAVLSVPTDSVTARAQGARVETRKGDLGTYLTNGAGRTLYLFAADHDHKSTCTGSCATTWPPLITKGKPTAGGKARPGKLGTVKRQDGSKQVTYGGHPLYYYAGDASAGQTTGEGLDSYGAKWWVVSPAGKPIKQ